MNVKKEYSKPCCIIVDCKLTNVILADSQLQRSSGTQIKSDGSNSTPTGNWGNIWKN
ncbi:MAG: hypothetical protein IKJ97_05670 [Bacteroidaceae bacterium]|nr:hypothetical protein [Bacteroidaceae bacterium]